MCSTTMISADAPKAAGGLGRKRGRDDGQGGSRPIKRVTFSNRDFVLGTAQEYDRSSAPIPASAFSFNSHNTCQGSSSDSGGSSQPKANFCGIWRRSHGFNWAALLKLSGVHQDAIPAQAARMQASSVLHLIDHDDSAFRLMVYSNSGHNQDQHFNIGGQLEPNDKNSATIANMRWTKNGQALVLTSVDAATGDEMVVSRHLAFKGSTMVQHYRARRASTGESAEAVTIFHRVVRRRA